MLSKPRQVHVLGASSAGVSTARGHRQRGQGNAAHRPTSILWAAFSKKRVNGTFPTASRAFEGEGLGQQRDAFSERIDCVRISPSKC